MTEVALAASGSAAAHAAPPVARVFVKDQASEAIFRQCFAALSVADVQFAAGTVSNAVPVLAREKSPKLLVVDISGVEDPVAGLRQLAEVCEPDVHVVVIGERNDIILYRDMKNAGVAEYFLKPVVRDLLIRTCKSILFPDDHTPSLRTGKLVFMLGVRGGTGATTIAINTAWHLAEARRRRTLLLDLDLQTGDVPLQLDNTPAHALREALDHPERVDKLYLERGTKPITGRLDMLASLGPLNSPGDFSADAVLSLLDKLLPHYRFMIVDLPHCVAVRTNAMLSLPSTCLVISNASLSAARDTARWAEVLGANTSDRSALYVLNHTAAHGGLSAEEFAKASGKQPDFIIPYSRDLAEASTLGIKSMQKCSTFKNSLKAILSQLTGEALEGRVSFFQRVFG